MSTSEKVYQINLKMNKPNFFSLKLHNQVPQFVLHAPPFRVHQDILHESPISHIRCIYLKRIQNELLNFFPRQGLFTSFSHSLVLVKFQYSAWLFFICVFQTGFCTIFTSFNVRAAQPRVPHSVYCTLVPREITFISTFLSTLCTTCRVSLTFHLF